ncbi:MAG: acyl-[Lachnospiraceae bacterium]|nr:acyl-[acyl-carrier-protein] thioesterase [Lachnospiraceae bacterium]
MKTSIHTEISFSEIGNDGRISFGGIIDQMQDSSNVQSEALGVGVSYQAKRDRAWILSSWEIKIKRLPKYMDKVVVSTWPYSFRGATGRRNYTIAMEGTDENIVEADSVWALFDVKKNFITRITEEDSKAYECEEKLDMEYSKGKILRANDYAMREIFKVRKYQLDTNNHMNNGWYVKIAEEFVEDKENVNSIRVEYKKSALYDDTIIAYVAKETDRLVVELRNDLSEIFAIVEFGMRN